MVGAVVDARQALEAGVPGRRRGALDQGVRALLAGTGLGVEVAVQTGEQQAAVLHHFGGQLGLAGVHRVDQRGDVVATGQQQFDQGFAQHHGALAHLIEHALDHMGEGHHAVEPEQAGRALDGVRGAEDRVDALHRVALIGHPQQGGLHLLQQFAAFDQEGLQGFVQIHGGLV